MAATKPDRLHYTGNDEADALLAHDPFALLVGFALDQQVPVPTAFQGPLKLKQRLGTLDPGQIAATDPGRLEEIFREKPAIHRFPGNMARRVQDLASVVVEEYGGDAERVWREAADGAELRKRISGLPGFGEMKVKALGAVLWKRFGVPGGGGARPWAIRRSGTWTPPRRSRSTRPRSARTRRSSALSSNGSRADNGGVRAAALAVAMIALACAGGSAYALRVPGAPKCTVFPKSNPWNRRVDKLPVARNSAAVIASIGVDTGLHADFGSGLWEGSPIGIPFDVVTRKTPRAKVGFEYADESDRVGYPIPKRVHIEGGSDHHALLLDRDACRLYELGGLEKQGGRWHAWAGATWSLRSNHVRPAGWTSADAAGLPIFPGLAR